MSKLQKAALRSLRPTQRPVGMIAVRDKKKHLAQLIGRRSVGGLLPSGTGLARGRCNYHPNSR